MNVPSLDWLFDKDNSPEDKDNPSDVKMISPLDPKTVRFVSPPETDQPPHSTTHSENDDMLTKTAIMDDISLMEWTPDNNDPPNNKDNSPNVKKSSISYAKIQKFVKHLTDNPPSTIHTNNIDNSDNTDTFTPSPSTSHKTNTTSIALVMTNGYVSIGPSLHRHHHHPYQNTDNTENNITLPSTSHEIDSIHTNQVITDPKYHPYHPLHNDCPDGWEFDDNFFNNDDSTTTPSPSTITSTTTPSTKSQCNVLEQRKKRRRRKERDEKAKELEWKVHALQQQLREKEEKQKQKEESTTELHKSLEHCKLLEMKKLKQLDNLIEEKKQEEEECRRQMKRNKILDKKYKHNMNAFLKARDVNRLSEKKKLKQLDVLIQQQKQYEIKNKQRKMENEEKLWDLE